MFSMMGDIKGYGIKHCRNERIGNKNSTGNN